MRVLFLDDDPCRAELFLERHPEAVWVETAGDCIARLSEDWEEVFLDHDLGGEHYVDTTREDCGMEVVRWLCKESRSHLLETRFVIHSHNIAAALVMVLLMRETGYRAEFLPFGFRLELDPLRSESPEQPEPPTPRSRASALLRQWLSRLARFFKRS